MKTTLFFSLLLLAAGPGCSKAKQLLKLDDAPGAASVARSSTGGGAAAATAQTSTSSAKAATAGPARATFIPSNIEYAKEKLYFTVWLDHATPGQRVSVTVAGTGVTGNAIEGVVGADGEYVCGSHQLDAAYQSYSLDDLCSFDGRDFKAGTYALEIKLDGKSMAKHEFQLLALPSSNRRTALAVDPATRVGKAYNLRMGPTVWFSVDARRPRPLLSLVWFRNGRYARIDGGERQGPVLDGDAEYLWAVPVIVRDPSVTESGKSDYDGEWELYAFVDDQPAGAWKYARKEVGDKVQWSGIQFGRIDGAYGPIEPLANPPAERLARARQAVAEKLVVGPTVLDESLVCAIAKDKDAYDTLVSIRQLDEQIGNSSWTFVGAQETINSRYSTSRERDNARKTQKTTHQANAKMVKIREGLQVKLRKLSRSQKPGCLDKLFGEAKLK